MPLLEKIWKPFCCHKIHTCTNPYLQTVQHVGYLKVSKKVRHKVYTSLCPAGDSTSVATEYSLKFDESMTEDEIEERSFRSLLPSEAHRRGTKEKKSHHHEESEDDGAHSSKALICGAHKVLKVKGQ